MKYYAAFKAAKKCKSPNVEHFIQKSLEKTDLIFDLSWQKMPEGLGNTKGTIFCEGKTRVRQPNINGEVYKKQ